MASERGRQGSGEGGPGGHADAQGPGPTLLHIGVLTVEVGCGGSYVLLAGNRGREYYLKCGVWTTLTQAVKSPFVGPFKLAGVARALGGTRSPHAVSSRQPCATRPRGHPGTATCVPGLQARPSATGIQFITMILRQWAKENEIPSCRLRVPIPSPHQKGRETGPGAGATSIKGTARAGTEFLKSQVGNRVRYSTFGYSGRSANGTRIP